ncbi:MAG: sugar transferase [Rhodobacteraceae bacterium]|nr:sugar transferase [Paracoccaceae bacterium]
MHSAQIARDCGPAAAASTIGRPARRLPRLPALYRSNGKRAFDIVLVLAAAPFVVPLIAALALAVALTGGRPFYRQARLGRGGRVFSMLKLRTMVVDAEARLAAHLAADPAARAEWDRHQKLAHDPRITRIGRFLRQTSLDELPQLWNVLLGEMSLVGPRPMMVGQAPLYPGRGYYRLRPGISGYWQIAERSRTTFEARAGFDDAYERDLSLPTDLRVLWRTLAVVGRRTGC